MHRRILDVFEEYRSALLPKLPLEIDYERGQMDELNECVRMVCA